MSWICSCFLSSYLSFVQFQITHQVISGLQATECNCRHDALGMGERRSHASSVIHFFLCFFSPHARSVSTYRAIQRISWLQISIIEWTGDCVGDSLVPSEGRHGSSRWLWTMSSKAMPFASLSVFSTTKRDPTNNLRIDGLECSFLLSLAWYGCPPSSPGGHDACFLSSREKRERESSLPHLPCRGKSDDEYETMTLIIGILLFSIWRSSAQRERLENK